MQRLDGASKAWLFTLVLVTLGILGVGTRALRDWLRERSAARDVQDARSPEEAFRDLWAALERRDAAEAALYVPTARLPTFKTGDEVIDSFLVLSPVKDMRIGRSTTTGDRAVLFARAASEDVTDEKGRPAPIDIIVRMVQEDGHWKVLSQRWLVSTPPATEQRDALAWLKGGR